MLTLSVKADVRSLARKLDSLARKQLPFATAQAINATAEKVRDAERENMSKVLDNPRAIHAELCRDQASDEIEPCRTCVREADRGVVSAAL